jgi:hypothetical protein
MIRIFRGIETGHETSLHKVEELNSILDQLYCLSYLLQNEKTKLEKIVRKELDLQHGSFDPLFNELKEIFSKPGLVKGEYLEIRNSYRLVCQYLSQISDLEEKIQEMRSQKIKLVK